MLGFHGQGGKSLGIVIAALDTQHPKTGGLALTQLWKALGLHKIIFRIAEENEILLTQPVEKIECFIDFLTARTALAGGNLATDILQLFQ